MCALFYCSFGGFLPFVILTLLFSLLSQNEAVIKSEQDILQDRERARQQREEREKIARERKERMRQLEKKAELLAKKSEGEIAEDAKKKAIREMAEKQIDLNIDAVKMLQSMGQRAIAFTVRDQQLDEKKRLEDLEHQVDRRTDMMMEVDRLKDLRRREEEELAKRTKRVQDRSVINEQIAARQKAHLLELEAREQENLAMRALMAKFQSEDQVAAERRKKEIEKSREEVLVANAEAIRRKKAAREAEKKEMEDILIYQAMKVSWLRLRSLLLALLFSRKPWPANALFPLVCFVRRMLSLRSARRKRQLLHAARKNARQSFWQSKRRPPTMLAS